MNAQTVENLSEQKALNAMFSQYDTLYAQNIELTEQNNVLRQQSASIAALISKDKVVAALNKRA